MTTAGLDVSNLERRKHEYLLSIILSLHGGKRSRSFSLFLSSGDRLNLVHLGSYFCKDKQRFFFTAAFWKDGKNPLMSGPQMPAVGKSPRSDIV